MSWELARGQVWEADDQNTRLRVEDATLEKPTARYEAPVYITVEVVKGRHTDVETEESPPRIERDTLLRNFSLMKPVKR